MIIDAMDETALMQPYIQQHNTHELYESLEVDADVYDKKPSPLGKVQRRVCPSLMKGIESCPLPAKKSIIKANLFDYLVNEKLYHGYYWCHGNDNPKLADYADCSMDSNIVSLKVGDKIRVWDLETCKPDMCMFFISRKNKIILGPILQDDTEIHMEDMEHRLMYLYPMNTGSGKEEGEKMIQEPKVKLWVWCDANKSKLLMKQDIKSIAEK